MDPRNDSTPTDREFHRRDVTHRLLTSLEDLVWRYRAFATRPELTELCAESLTAEVAHHLALARTSLPRHPALHPDTSGPRGRQTPRAERPLGVYARDAADP